MNAKSFIGGLLAGATVGVAIGVLLAPDTGVNTQQKLVKGVRKVRGAIVETAENSIHSLKDRFKSKGNEPV